MNLLNTRTAQGTSTNDRLDSGRAITESTLLAVLICFMAVLIWLPRLKGPIDLRWDAGVYYVLGTSLSEGKGYRLLNEPGQIQELQYPPALPVFIAAHQWMLGTTDPTTVGRSLRISYFFLFVLYTFIIFWLLKNSLPVKYAFLATIICLLTLHNYFLSDLAFPEIPFALVTIFFVLCNQRRHRQLFTILAALLGITAYGLRTMGVALLGAWVVESLLHKQFKQTVFRLLIALIPFLAWQGYIMQVESRQDYKHPSYEYQRADYMFYNVSYANNIFRLKDPFMPELGPAKLQDIAQRFLHNLTELPMSVAGAVSSPKGIWELPWKIFDLPFPIAVPWPVYVVLTILALLVFGGIAVQLAARQWFIPIYILLSFCLISLTPWPAQFTRYLAPLAPFLALSLFQMLLVFKNQLARFQWKPAGLVFAAAVTLMILIPQFLTLFLSYAKWHQQVRYTDQKGKPVDYRLFFYNDSYRVLDAASEWLRERAKPDDVISVSMPHWIYLRTGLKTVMPPFEQDPEKAQRLLDSVPVTYLILDEGLAVDSRRYTEPVVRKFPQLWKAIYSTEMLDESGKKLANKFEIYERINPPSVKVD